MSDTLLISELAARSGFTASALRYYEQVGLLAATDRTPAGYRLYDDEALTRLRFIDRSKRLGLPLEEIRELMGIWDQGHCAHVQDRLRAHIKARSAQVEVRIGELRMLGAQLDAARVDLEGQSPEGSCGGECGCIPAGHVATRVAQPVEVACTLSPADQPGRLDEWNELLVSAIDRTQVAGGVRLRFPADPELAGRLGDLAVREQSCCSFFTFTLHLTPAAVTLDVQAPEDALPVLAELFGIPA